MHLASQAGLVLRNVQLTAELQAMIDELKASRRRLVETQDTLQNIAKYAGASQATVRLPCSQGSLQFTITDDGTGFDTATARHGTGLPGMADRLAALGGTLAVRPGPDKALP